MKRRLIILPVVLLLLALAAAGWWLWLRPHGAPGPAPAPAEASRVETVNGETVVVIPPAMQAASGIATHALAATTMHPEQLVYASVIDLQQLLDLGARLAAARAEREAAAAQAAASQAQAQRTQALFQDDRNASQKALQDARAAAQVDQAKLAASEAALAGVGNQMRQQFGSALAGAANSRTSDIWRQLESGQAAVLRVALPASVPAPHSLAIDAPTGGTLTGSRLSAAPQVDPLMQGAPYFYLVDAPLPAGTRTIAHAGASGADIAGVLVPDPAIVWYGDSRWTYLKLAPGRFVRRLVKVAALGTGGVLAADGLRAGQEVVTQGAALLLSEEQRPRGIATQCKDPPECDD